MRAAEARIDLTALQENLRRVRDVAPATRVMAIVKANGYGHGLLRVVNALHSVDAYGVARLDEALRLRDAGVRRPIVLLEGFSDMEDLEVARHHGLSVVVHHSSQIELLEKTRLSAPLSVWLKVDSGMHRLGFRPVGVAAAYHRLVACGNVVNPCRLMTHLACADERDGTDTAEQIACFNEAVNSLAGERCIANSAAILGWPQSHAQWVRPGIMLYGVSPFPDTLAIQESLTPVMTLASRLIAVNRCRRGDRIGYGGSWTCPENMPVGVAAVGYGDGYPRGARSGTPVLVNGRRVPLIGRVSMDMICVDLRAQPDARVGDIVTLWGRGLPVEEVARNASTIPYDLLCGVTQRVRFVEC